MKHYTIALLSLLWIGILTNGFGQGAILVQHSGFNNPTSEGFTLAGIGSQANVGPVTGGGVDAWNTTVSNVNNNISYVYSLTPLQQSETVGADWILSASLQVSESGGGPSAFIQLNSASMGIGSEANGDPFVDGTRSNPVFLLSGGGDGYHNYQLVYTAATGDVALWVDSVEQVSDLFNETATIRVELLNGCPVIHITAFLTGR